VIDYQIHAETDTGSLLGTETFPIVDRIA